MAPALLPARFRSKPLSVEMKSVSEEPLSLKLPSDRVPASGAVVSTVTSTTLVVDVLPAASVTLARNW